MPTLPRGAPRDAEDYELGLDTFVRDSIGDEKSWTDVKELFDARCDELLCLPSDYPGNPNRLLVFPFIQGFVAEQAAFHHATELLALWHGQVGMCNRL